MLKIRNSHFKELKKDKSFGRLPSGEEVFSYNLSNKNGFEVEVINYGAVITSVKIPISKNKKLDVVLGFETLENYIQSFNLPNAPYLGTIVGRYAGRINNAEFILNEDKIVLTKNHGSHQLHGGINGFSKALWNVKNVTSNAITLEYISAANEENFPGQLTTQVTYTITEDNELKVDMIAKSTEDTIINLTQHSYFNLDGQSEDIVNQDLFVNSSKTLETNIENIPTGRFFEVARSPFDFNSSKECPTKIDNTFVLNDKDTVSVILKSKKNNLKMSVYTNQPAIHIYVGGNCFNQIKGKGNASYHPLSGICFEAQNFPDAPNHKHFPNAILKKDETYHHKTIFKFEKL
ncbi:aldose epimerase family protein [Flavobacterium sp.]|uniref:aldose epimerase family protein n=1 Tax=Flavobacterium sp. TaxID=239 RepID=UPI0026326C14|nr:aldose epimerase family protein [Flavobacterium sp.]